ncbi:MAG TPA: hypothetical protein VEC01_07790 [Noviherbaspirillum sp.]|uniref:hypothetical protein n=1 Tax=Noviherbaspirillum sp. TaxID=1926288 RepID=UPI002D4872AA|nr:hypothetical protein [Noviherbaspirillum sp.]HYD95211.1 hypothetical protein [Noviherbaspirillum sp.]
MNTNFENTLDPTFQAALADEIVSMVAAVVSNASAPDSAARALVKSRQDSLAPEQRAAAAALQAYGIRCAAEVFTPALEPEAVERAARLRQALEAQSANEALALLDAKPDAGMEFKSRMCIAIATKCAELVAAEIERAKNGPVTILNEDDAKVFEARHAQHQEQRAQAATAFLSSLPVRFPSFGVDLFISVRREVQRHIEENHKRPDIHAAVAALFDDAVAAMPAETRERLAAAGG